MNTKELRKLEKFHKKHKTKGKHSFLSIALYFTGSEIGVHILVECLHCNIREDITDYDAW